MFRKFIKLFFITIILLSSCKSKKKVASNANKTKQKTERIEKKSKTTKTANTTNTKIKPTPKNASYTEIVTIYIDNYSTIAKEEMVQYGIPASITLAQGILESGAGRAELSKKSNNHFGIKCHKGWTGERVYHDDDELQECFRKYKDPKYSFRDHSLFLTQRSRYKDLFSYKKDDYKSWAKGLRKAGYATDPKYPQKLISIVEKYKLYTFDEEVLGKKSKRKNKKDSKIKTYIVEKGDTLYSLSRKFDVSVDSLKEYNGLESNTITIGQELYVHIINN